MRASIAVSRITVSTISISLLIAAALSLCPPPSSSAPTMQWSGDIYADGNAGIGTTNPLAKLHVEGDVKMGTTAGGMIQFKRSDGCHNAYIASNADNTELLVCSNGGSSWVTIQGHPTTGHVRINPSGGNVGIGTTAPAAKLHVCASASYGYAARIFNDGNGTQYGGLVIQNGQDVPTATNTAIRFLDGNGDQVGTITWDSNSLDVTYTSDANLKMNIRDCAEDTLSKIRETRVATYERTAAPGQTHTGFIAQELAAQFPEAVFGDAETSTGQTTYCIKPMKLIPHMFHAIQQAGERIAKLEAAAGSGALGEVATSGISTVSGASTADVAPEETMSDAEILRLTESVLRKMGIEPWVEITVAEAWEEVDATTQVSAVETVTRYRFNPETRLAEAYSVQETVTRQAPTGRRIVQLKKDARLDEKTGKFYRWSGLGGATPQQTAAALGKILTPGAVSFSSSLRAPLSGFQPQVSSLWPQTSAGR